MTLKPPPHSIEAEQALLGALMISPDVYPAIQGVVTTDDFYRRDHRTIFEAIDELAERRMPTDIITIEEALKRRGALEDAGGLAYIGTLAKDCPSPSAAPGYAKIIRDKAIRRRALVIAYELAGAVEDDGAIDAAIAALMSLSMGGSDEHEHTIRDALKASLERLDEKIEAGGGLVGLPTGLSELDNALGGFHDGDLVVIGARPKMGKAQPLDAKVLLADGTWTRMGDLKVGDQLASQDGSTSCVEAIYPQGVRPIYRVTFSDGREVECDAEHLWQIESCKFKGTRIETTKTIMRMLDSERYRNRLRVPAVSGWFGTPWNWSIHPWLVGFLLGYGCLRGSQVRFSTSEPYILAKVKERLPKSCSVSWAGEGFDYRITSNKPTSEVLDALRGIGIHGRLAHEKKLPDGALGWDRTSRTELLLGLIESDGWRQGYSVLFSSSSRALAEGVQSLARSLGGLATIRTKRVNGYRHNGEKRVGRTAYIVTLRLPGDVSIQSPRLARSVGSAQRTIAPTIRNIEYVGEKKAQCIRVSHPSHLYVTDGYTVTHNTALLLNMALAPNVPVGIVSAEQGHQELGDRFYAIEGRVPMQKIRTARVDDSDFAKMADMLQRTVDRPIHIYDAPGVTITDVMRRARRWKKEYGIRALYVDYLQKIRPAHHHDSRVQEVGEVARSLKDIARELRIPVIALGQVKRDVEMRANKRPGMGDLSDSSEIEKEADTIITIYRDEVYNPDTPEKGVAELDICANRSGPSGLIRSVWRGEFLRFEDYIPESRFAERYGDKF